MKIQVFTTEHTSCDLAAVRELVNALQYFFVMHTDIAAVTLPQNLIGEPLISAQELIEFVRTDILPNAPAADLYILLTNVLLSVPANRASFQAGNIGVVASHLWTAADVPSTFRYARHILQLGLSTVVKHKSNVRSCIGNATDRFDCLCSDCESQLHDAGYRDGIVCLKEGFNVLNQLQSGGSLDRIEESSDLQSAELRLANQYVAEFTRENVSLRDHIVLVVLHFLSDLVPFVRALHALGVCFGDIYLVAKPYPYARRDEVTHVLERFGVTVRRAVHAADVSARAEQVLNDLSVKPLPPEKRILVIEDGGYFAPILHQPRFTPLLKRCVGTVEQTQKGANEDKQIQNLAVPVLSVAESAFKKMYESPEIGRVAVQNISRFTPNLKLSGRHVTVFGFGSVGQEIAFHLTNAFNMTVSVVDCDDSALLRARHRRSIVAEAERTFDELKFKCPALVVGTTGTTSITEAVIRQLSGDVVLVSTSSDQIEIDVGALQRLARTQQSAVEGKTTYQIGSDERPCNVTLLAEGYPINFYGSESLPNDTIDPIMTLLLVCAVELTLKNDWEKKVDARVVAEIVTRRNLVRRFLSLA